jgi:hypothetical protein
MKEECTNSTEVAHERDTNTEFTGAQMQVLVEPLLPYVWPNGPAWGGKGAASSAYIGFGLGTLFGFGFGLTFLSGIDLIC